MVESADHVVLLLPFTPSLLIDPNPLLPIISGVVKTTARKSLVVLFSSPTSIPQPGPSKGGQLYAQLQADPSANFKLFQRFLGEIYATLAAAQWGSGKVLIDVEVIFEGEGVSLPSTNSAETIRIQGYEDLPTGLDLPPSSKSLPLSEPIPPAAPDPPVSQASTKRTVALGGTFDHLHAAHKLLLQLSLFLCTRRLIVGVMADSKLATKSNADLIEPIDERIEVIEVFLERRGAKRKHTTSEGKSAELEIGDERVMMDVVEINDPYGPTAWDEDIQALVVSQETLSGGGLVNTLRKEKGLRELEVFVVDVIAAKSSNEEGEASSTDLKGVTDESVLKDLKMGSTGIRQWIKEHPETT